MDANQLPEGNVFDRNALRDLVLAVPDSDASVGTEAGVVQW
jgi:hypothetical protein